ncbi:MAG: hypothetical protein O3A00_18395 [Planctomycetota bacterium]|nr:hypothetical protein [Planctomycetota bacterium]
MSNTTTMDFARSFLTFRIDVEKKPPKTVSHKPPYNLNNARIQLECCCEVSEKATGWSQRYVLGASCKTERVGVERDIWTEPNADFVPIFSDDGFLNLKTYARAGTDVELYPPGSGFQTDRQTGLHEDVFDTTRIDIAECPGMLLDSAADIVRATLDNVPLNARTRIETDRFVTVIEYPIKTMNANERDTVYQTDTGPVLLPDLSRDTTSMLSGFELAFAAFNRPDWIEFLVRTETQASADVNVFHYSKSIRFDAENSVIRLL